VKRSTPHEFEGRPQLIFTLEESDQIDDLEVFLRDLAIRSGWGPGDYLIEACAKGQHGVVLWTESIPLGNMPGGSMMTGGGSIGGGGPVEQIRQVGELVGAVRAVSGDGGSNMTTALDATVRAFSAGISAAPKPADPMNSPLVAMLMPVLVKVVDHIMTPRVEPPRDDMGRMIEFMERMGYKREPVASAASPMETIAASITNAKAIVDAATVLTGGAAGAGHAQPSSLVVWAQTLQAIMPGVVQMVGQVSGVVRDVVDARRSEMAMRAGLARPVDRPATSTEVAAQSPLSGFERAIVEGIHTPEMFQGVANRLTEMGHGGLIAAIKGGQVNSEMIVTQGRSAIPQLALPGADAFITRFVEWVQAGGDVVAAPAGPQKKVRCTKCGNEGTVSINTPLSTMQCLTRQASPDGSERICGGPVVQIAG
jgi:hypothetical protein